MLRLAMAAAVAAAVIAAPVTAQAAKLVSETAYAPVGVTQFVIHSDKVGRDFLVVVSTPPAPLSWVDPSQRQVPGKLPAIYALDGGYRSNGPITQMMIGMGALPPAYVVEVGYVAGQPNLRNIDMMHRPADIDGRPSGGGGAAFQAFLVEELRPFLEARYPIDPKRAILFGHSFGGLFTANVLATAPAAFDGYVVASPSAWNDPALIPALKAAASKGGGRKVYVAVGGDEEKRMLEGAEGIATALTGPGSAFKVEKRVFEGEGHVSLYPLLVPLATRFVLTASAPAVAQAPVTAADLDRVVGVYAIGDGRTITVTREGLQMFVAATGIPGRAELTTNGPRRYSMPAYGAEVIFDGPAGGAATSVVSRVGTVETRATRNVP